MQDHSIEKVDIRLGNVCNFACNFCNANNSHTIAKERGETVLNNWFENKNEIFAASTLSKLRNLAPVIVIPDLLTPGIKDKT